MAQSQKSVIHAVEKSMSILNLTNNEISENREAINDLIATARSIDLRITNSTQEIFQILLPLHKFVTAYMHIESCLSETESLVQRFLLHLESVYSKLDILLLGRLSVEIISPLTLHNSMTDIANSLPEGSRLLVDPSLNIWHYYKNLQCTTMIHNMRLHLSCSVSIVKSNDEGAVLLIHNLPIRTKESSLFMEIETESLIIYANEFSFLPPASICTQQPTAGNCIVSGLPQYAIDENIPCPVALYLDKADLAKKVCPVKVNSGHMFPFVKRIGIQRWAISLSSNINMNIICTDRANETIALKPPIVIFKLPNFCQAIGPTFKISMDPIFSKEINVNDHDLLNVKHINNSFVWEDGRELDVLRDMLKAKFPDELKSIKGTMLGDVISEIQNKLEGEGIDLRPDRNFKIGMGNMVMVNLVIIVVIVAACAGIWHFRGKGERTVRTTAPATEGVETDKDVAALRALGVPV